MPGHSINSWLNELGSNQRYSKHTVAAYRRDLALLQEIYPDQEITKLNQQQIRSALAKLHAQGHKPRSLARALAAWRGYFEWLAPKIDLGHNPTNGIKAPKISKSLPKALSVDQAQALLERNNLPPADSTVAKRDMAMFELLYSSGLRVSELVSLDWQAQQNKTYESTSWLELDEKQAVIQGKGHKTRLVPLGGKAIEAIRIWLSIRAELLNQKSTTNDHAALFLGVRGKRITSRVVQKQLAILAQQVGLPMHVHPHSLRHSFASHMLQSAQDLRAVQELLGHANISTTQIYTRLDFQHLSASYDKAHPRAKRKNHKS